MRFILLLVFLCSLALGCGGGGGAGESASGSTGGASVPSTPSSASSASVVFQFARAQSVLTVPSATARLRILFFSGESSEGALLLERVVDFAPTVRIEGVPVTARVWNMQSGTAERDRPVHGQDTPVEHWKHPISHPGPQDGALRAVTPFHLPDTHLKFQEGDGGQKER